MISENSEYLKNYKIPHIFITFSRNKAACHAKWCIIIFVEFRTFRNRWGQNGNTHLITPQTVTLCLRELYILLSWKLVHKKRRDHLHGIGYFFPPKFKMRLCKDDLFERNFQNNQLLERNLRKFSKELNVLSHFVMKN